MPSKATVKDVLYALEYTGAELCRWPSPGNHKPAWSLEPSGTKVDALTAEKVRSHVAIVSIQGKRGETRFRWRTPA